MYRSRLMSVASRRHKNYSKIIIIQNALLSSIYTNTTRVGRTETLYSYEQLFQEISCKNFRKNFVFVPTAISQNWRSRLPQEDLLLIRYILAFVSQYSDCSIIYVNHVFRLICYFESEPFSYCTMPCGTEFFIHR